MASAPKSYPPIILGFFARGLNTNRQPLFSALTGVGLQVIQFKDYLIDGINVECSDHFTLQRAPGFTKYSTAQLAVSETVNAFYGTRDLSNNVYVLADTNQNLYKVGASSLTSLLTKSVSGQGYVQRVGGVTYYANGTDFKKWIPANGSSMVPWGVAAPLVAPTLTPGQVPGAIAFWSAGFFLGGGTTSGILDNNGNIQVVTSSVSAGGSTMPIWNTVLNSITYDGGQKWQNYGTVGPWAASTAASAFNVVLDSKGNLQSVSATGTSGSSAPAWNSTLSGTTTDNTITWTNIGKGTVVAYSGFNYVFAYRTVSGNLSTASPAMATGPVLASQPIAPIYITAWSITSNVVTFTSNNSLTAGAQVILSGFGTSTFFNGQVLTVLSTGLSATQFEANFTHANGSGTENGLAYPVIAKLQGPSSSNPECNSTASITSVSVTGGVVTITANNNFSPGISVGITGLTGASFLNGANYPVVTANATSFTISLPNQANYGPTGDSGTASFLAVEIYRTKDGGGVFYFAGPALNGGTWTGYDVAADSALTTALVAPLAHTNDPPPGQTGSIVNGSGTLLGWWSNRVWIAAGNSLYFSGGPDTLNGIAEECFPPANVFKFPGNITALKATTGGLVVFTTEEVWAILGGPQTVSLYPERILEKFGVLSANCVHQDGDTLYAYNSQRQLVVLNGAGKVEVGTGSSPVSPVGNLLNNGQTTSIATVSAWTPTASYLTIHRQGEDSGLYLSNGVESIIRYGLNVGNFSPVRQPGMGTAGAIASIETSPGQYTFLLAPTAAHDFIYQRSLSTFTDNGSAYASSTIIGNIVASEPGQQLFPLRFLAAYLYNVGSVPTMSFMPNDIGAGTFTNLPTAQAEPAFLAAPTNLMSKRWPVSANTGPTPLLVRHVQLKVNFGNTDTVKNELIELVLRPDMEQLI